MKRLIQTCSLLGLLLGLMVSAAQAQISKTYRVEIPFDFNIGQDAYIPGTYQVSVLDNMVLLRHEKATTSRVLTGTAEEKGRRFAAPQFYFERVGGKNVLVEIAGKDFNVKLETASVTTARRASARKLTARNYVSAHAAQRAGN